MEAKAAAGVEERPAELAATHRDVSRWEPWIQALKLVALTRLIFFAISYAAAWLLAPGDGVLDEGFLDVWHRWDTRHFIQIATFGYTDPRTDPHATAFFPLFPLLLRGLGMLGINHVLAGLVISFASSVVACAYLYRLVSEEIDAAAGRSSLLYLLLFPTGVFLAAAYSEALFLAGAIAAFYYARRGRWWYVALPGAIAMGARFAGAFLVAGLAAEFLRQGIWRDWWRAGVALVASAIPLAAYCVYLAAAKGDPFYFMVDQREGWGRQFVGFVQSFQVTWNARTTLDYPTNWIFAWRMEILAAFFGLGLVIWAATRKEWGYAVYMGTFLATLMASAWYFSIPRMLLSFFPGVVLLASWTRRDPARHEIALVTMAPLAAVGVVVFTRGAWFF